MIGQKYIFKINYTLKKSTTNCWSYLFDAGAFYLFGIPRCATDDEFSQFFNLQAIINHVAKER
ncbi:MAG: hypothetical protein FWD09_04680 [Lentimicrobiaceae bacterium]|nr:hypothetical protein [Lentimicrobiaceae bacterium]